MEYQINDKVKYLNGMLCEIDNMYQTILMKKNLSDSEYVVLFSILELGEGCLQKDIANNSYINKKTTNSTIKKLEKNGLITLKAGKYPNMHIYLTDSGKEFVKTHIVPIVNMQTNVMNSVPVSDFEVLVELHSKYMQIFKNEIEKLPR